MAKTKFKISREVKKMIVDVCKNLPRYNVLDSQGNIKTMLSIVRGSVLIKQGHEKIDLRINGKTKRVDIDPGKYYSDNVPIKTDPYKILTKAYEAGGLPTFERALRKYMADYNKQMGVTPKKVS